MSHGGGWNLALPVPSSSLTQVTGAAGPLEEAGAVPPQPSHFTSSPMLSLLFPSLQQRKLRQGGDMREENSPSWTGWLHALGIDTCFKLASPREKTSAGLSCPWGQSLLLLGLALDPEDPALLLVGQPPSPGLPPLLAKAFSPSPAPQQAHACSLSPEQLHPLWAHRPGLCRAPPTARLGALGAGQLFLSLFRCLRCLGQSPLCLQPQEAGGEGTASEINKAGHERDDSRLYFVQYLLQQGKCCAPGGFAQREREEE